MDTYRVLLIEDEAIATVFFQTALEKQPYELICAASAEEAQRAFLGGVLHDIGKVIINNVLPDEFNRIVAQCQPGSEYSLLKAEQDVLGYTHAEVGAITAELWHYPADLVESIRYHHTPRLAKRATLVVTSIHIGNEIAKALGTGGSPCSLARTIDDVHWHALGITADDFPGLVRAIYTGYDKARDLFSF